MLHNRSTGATASSFPGKWYQGRDRGRKKGRMEEGKEWASAGGGDGSSLCHRIQTACMSREAWHRCRLCTCSIGVKPRRTIVSAVTLLRIREQKFPYPEETPAVPSVAFGAAVAILVPLLLQMLRRMGSKFLVRSNIW